MANVKMASYYVLKGKGKKSRKRPGVAERVPGG
jgi:hypothetical protein